jgi:DNA-binding response OmpR family regulator
MSVQGERILVVEDSPTQAQYLRLVLEDEGYRVDTAANGLIALNIVRSSPPDLVLSDIVMPEMDGHQFCQAMKADRTTRAIPLIMLSSLQAHLDRARALENGADDFLNKPVDADELLTRVRSLVRLKTLNDRLVERDRTMPRRVLVALTPGPEAIKLRDVLQSTGHDLEVVTDGDTLLHATRSMPPDLVIADVELPNFEPAGYCGQLKADEST